MDQICSKGAKKKILSRGAKKRSVAKGQRKRSSAEEQMRVAEEQIYSTRALQRRG